MLSGKKLYVSKLTDESLYPKYESVSDETTGDLKKIEVLSVIIPTYNRKGLIGYTLHSLNKTNHPQISFEVIVIDDGSTDGTKDFIRQNYPDVIVVDNTGGKGASHARNVGLAMAKGKYILYLDSDDMISKNYFSEKIKFLEAHPKIHACYGTYEYFDSNGSFNEQDVIFKHKYPMIHSYEMGKQHFLNYVSGNYIPQNAIVWRKNFLRKCNGHDESLLINQDVDLVIRAIFYGLKIVALEDQTNAYVRHHSLDARVGSAGNSKQKWMQELELRKKIFSNMKNFGYDDVSFIKALSLFLFGKWKVLRNRYPEIAAEYLKFVKEIYWPLPLRGSFLYRLLSYTLGPVNAVKFKYFILKRD